MENLIEKFNDLFVNDESDESKSNSILLIDASGSVKENFINGSVIFDKFLEIVKGLPQNDHRVMFWNSDRNSEEMFFQKGLYTIPFMVTKSSQLNQLFNLVKDKINPRCLTCPYLAFNSIPKEWIVPNKNTIIRLITDGQIGWNACPIIFQLRKEVQNSIKELFSNYKNVQLEIIAVEAVNRNFNDREGLSGAAGCDIYNVIVEGALTKKIKKFISYSPNNQNGFKHIENRIARPGFIPFGEKDFSVLNLTKFINYVSNLIELKRENEDDLLKIVQNLSHTLTILTEDKPDNIRKKNITLFSDMFRNSVLDTMIVNMLLHDSIERERQGKAELFASYRSNMRDFYKQAAELLMKNVRDATGIIDDVMTIPFKNIPILHASAELINSDVMIQKKKYMNGAITIGGIMVPVLPVIRDNMSLLNQQCVRQWTRSIISKIYGIDALGDIVIHTVLGINLSVTLSRLPPNVKNNFRRLALIMLQKKRLNVDKTEYENIVEGNLPLPNSGIITNFVSDMNKVKTQLGLNIEPLSVWYAMCLAIDDKKIINAQITHCYDAIKKDFPDAEPSDLLQYIGSIIKKSVEYQHVPYETSFDYTCPITLEDTSLTGGWICSGHNNAAGSHCKPMFVMSQSGYDIFITNDNTRICPYCYTPLNIENILPVDKKIELNEIFNFDKSNDIFGVSNQTNEPDAGLSNSNQQTNSNALDSKQFLILMKGTVGAGKTTLSIKLKERIQELGGFCCLEGMDQHRIKGASAADAGRIIKDNLIRAMQVNNSIKVIIIDTCGDNRGKNIFGVQFPSTWKRIEFFPNYLGELHAEYLAWTLRNVMSRDISSEHSTFFLEPATAGVDVCLEVHKKKAQSVFPKKNNTMRLNVNDCDGIISECKDMANTYQAMLDEKMTITNQIDDLINRMKL